MLSLLTLKIMYLLTAIPSANGKAAEYIIFCKQKRKYISLYYTLNRNDAPSTFVLSFQPQTTKNLEGQLPKKEGPQGFLDHSIIRMQSEHP